jgi:hypothetical protein
MTIEQQCEEAMRRIVQAINRAAGQHMRRMRAEWAARAAGGAA